MLDSIINKLFFSKSEGDYKDIDEPLKNIIFKDIVAALGVAAIGLIMMIILQEIVILAIVALLIIYFLWDAWDKLSNISKGNVRVLKGVITDIEKVQLFKNKESKSKSYVTFLIKDDKYCKIGINYKNEYDIGNVITVYTLGSNIRLSENGTYIISSAYKIIV